MAEHKNKEQILYAGICIGKKKTDSYLPGNDYKFEIKRDRAGKYVKVYNEQTSNIFGLNYFKTHFEPINLALTSNYLN